MPNTKCYLHLGLINTKCIYTLQNSIPTLDLKPVYTIKVFVKHLTKVFWRNICSKKIIPFIRSKFGQILIRVFIPSYLSVVNSKTSKMAELVLDSAKMSVKVFRKIGWVSIPSKSVKAHQSSLTQFLMQVHTIK